MIINLPANLQPSSSVKDKNYESVYSSLTAIVSSERIRSTIYYLSKDLLPRRVLNYTIPGHSSSTPEEADAWII
jgi:hypothetical protein